MADFPPDKLKLLPNFRRADGVQAALEEDLQQGVWTKSLPGIGQLMKRYGVSRPPIEQALARLQAKGILAAAEPGRSRRILAARPFAGSAQLVLLRKPLGKLAELSRQVYHALRDQVGAEGLRELVVSGDNALPEAARAVRREVEAGRVISLVGLSMSGTLLRQIVPRPAPVLMIGGSNEDAECSRVYFEIFEAVEEAVLRFLIRYRKSLSLVLIDTPARQADQFRAAARRAYERAGLRFDPRIHSPELKGGQQAMGVRHLASLPEIGELLTIEVDDWMLTTSILQSAGLTKPVKCLVDHRNFRPFDQPPSLLRVKVRDFVTAYLDWAKAVRNGERTFVYRQARIEWQF